MLESGLPDLAPGKTNCRSSPLRSRLHLLQDSERPRGQWHAVFAVRLHAFGRHRPGLVEQVDFVPPCADHFAGARGRKDQKFQRAGRNALLLPQARPGRPVVRHRAGRRGVRLRAPWTAPEAAWRDGRASAPGFRRRDSRAPWRSPKCFRCDRASGSPFRASPSRSVQAPSAQGRCRSPAPAARR